MTNVVHRFKIHRFSRFSQFFTVLSTAAQNCRICVTTHTFAFAFASLEAFCASTTSLASTMVVGVLSTKGVAKRKRRSENCAKMPKTSAFKLPSLKPDQNAPDGPRSIPELHAWQDWGYARIIDHKFERGKDLSHVN